MLLPTFAPTLALCLFLQDSSSEKPPGDKPQDPPAREQPAPQEPAAEEAAEPTFEVWDDRKAREVLREVDELTKGKRVPMRDRMQAVEMLAAGSNSRLAKPLAQMVLSDDSAVVKKAAAEALGHQPERDAKKQVAALLKNERLEEHPPVQAALVTALSKSGYTERDWKLIDGMFGKHYSPQHTGLQRAILQLVIQHQEKQAIDMLLDNLGEPVPADPEDASNPPAEYWEGRWKAWEVWREDVREALFVITGQRFSTKEEAQAWLKKNGRKIGIR